MRNLFATASSFKLTDGEDVGFHDLICFSMSMKQSFVIWPFIHGFAILALLKMGERALADQPFDEYTALSGFWEYYDPKTGKGYGAEEQLWSAALYLRVAAEFGHDVNI